MEFQARYTLIGLFSMAVISAVFIFIYWLNTIGGLQQRDYYKIRFEGQVLGLTRGSRVLYNGLHIGEVSELDLDFNHPDKLFATISVKKDFPLRKDTYVGLDYQSLTGGAAITLTGSSSSAALLKSTGAEIPLIIADKSAGASWIQAASTVLRKIDGILSENQQPLNESIVNIKNFTGLLSKNSDRIENILAGLERFAGGVKDKTKDIIYDLEIAEKITLKPENENWSITIAEPTVQLAYNTDKIMIQAKKGQTTFYPNGRWSDNLPNLVQSKIVQSFENAGLGDKISKPSFGDENGQKLMIDVRQFHIHQGETAMAKVIFFAKLSNPDGKVIKTKLISTTAPVTGEDEPAATKALSKAFQKNIETLMKWSLEETKEI